MDYAVLDVFTDTPLEGNPLAIVPHADELSSETMQKIAREFNLSETVFVLAREREDSTGRIRIFTPTYEMPFAGHPTVGAACWLSLKAGAGERVVLHENVGLVPCEVSTKSALSASARFRVPQVPEEVGVGPNSGAAARALGLSTDDIGFDAHAPSYFSAGVAFAYVPVKSREAINEASPDLGHWDEAFGSDQLVGVYVYCPETDDPKKNYHTRMFAPRAGVPEDPATGSAAAGFAGVVMKFETLQNGSHTVALEQGFEMERPSVITLEMDVQDGSLASAHIGGEAVIVAEGKLHL